MTPKWIEEAQRHIGLKEVPGKADNPTIQRWLKTLNAWWFDDATPWCGTTVAYCMKHAGFEVPKMWMRAKAWIDWGQTLRRPVHGCIVVFERQGGGHVGFVVGEDGKGNLMVLGGNQGDKVSIAPFSVTRAIAYRYPPGLPIPTTMLARMESDGKLSTNEA